jgi:hypothetical protein
LLKEFLSRGRPAFFRRDDIRARRNPPRTLVFGLEHCLAALQDDHPALPLLVGGLGFLDSSGAQGLGRVLGGRRAGGLGGECGLETLADPIADELGKGAADKLGKLLAHCCGGTSFIDATQEKSD